MLTFGSLFALFWGDFGSLLLLDVDDIIVGQSLMYLPLMVFILTVSISGMVPIWFSIFVKILSSSMGSLTQTGVLLVCVVERFVFDFHLQIEMNCAPRNQGP